MASSSLNHQVLAIFHAAAFQPAKRAELVAKLQADGVLRQAAVDELARLNDGQARSMLLDRDAISRITHAMLTEALRQAAFASGVRVE